MFDATIHLGDLISPAILGIGAWVLKRAMKPVKQTYEQVKGYDRRIESTAEVVDLHSDMLLKGGLSQGIELTAVSQRRRRRDVEYSG